MRDRIRRLLDDFGPGLLLAATGVGVGDMISGTVVGAEQGLYLVWALAAGVLLKFAITEGLARWQLATGTTLMEGWRDHLPTPVLLAFFAYFLVWSYFVSGALVAASSMVPAALFPVLSPLVWGVLHALLAALLVFWGSYQRLVQMMKVFVALMFSALIVTCLLILRSGARWGPVEPTESSLFYVLSLIAGVGGTVTLLSYGYWIREQRWSEPRRIGSVRNDLCLSFLVVFLFSFAMIFLSSQINWEGEILEEGVELCLILADRIAEETGQAGRLAFLLGFWGAAYTSVLGVWHGVPFLFDDWAHLWRGLPARGHEGGAYRGFLAYLMLAAISALFIQRPVWLMVAYTIVGAFFFPFVISTLLWMNNRSSWVGRDMRNGWPANTILVLGLVLFLYLGVATLW